MRFATYAAVGTAAFLIAIKVIAYSMTGSVSILGSLFDSGLDFAASVLNLIAVLHAIAPADKEHRFGHGKAEALAGLGQALLITGSAIFLAIESYSRLANPQPLANSGIGIAVVIISIAATFGLVTFQRRVIRQSGSLAISADQIHYKGDLLMNTGVLVAIVLAGTFKMTHIDSFFGLAIAYYLVQSAWEIARQSYDHLMDRELPDTDREKIKTIALDHPDVRAIHDLRTRNSGRIQIIQFHLEMDPGLPLLVAHRIMDEVESRVLAGFPRAEILIHPDPAGLEKLTKLEKS